MDEVRERLVALLDAATLDEPLARAIGRLMEAAHEFNRWEPGAAKLDDLLDAAEVYTVAVRIFRASHRTQHEE